MRAASSAPWNKGKLVGQKLPLKVKEVWTIRVRLRVAQRVRDLALFNLAIDSKLRSCDLLEWKISGCGVNPSQHEIARLLRGNEGLHRIAYAEKTANIAPAEREKWIKAFSAAYVENDRKRVVVAP